MGLPPTGNAGRCVATIEAFGTFLGKLPRCSACTSLGAGARARFSAARARSTIWRPTMTTGDPMDTTRRTLLTTGAAVAAAAATSRAFAQESATGAQGTAKFYEKGKVRIHYSESGSGFPLFVIPGGGLNSTMAALARPFDPRHEFNNDFRCIAADLRNAYAGQSVGPLEIERPWDAYTDDHLALLDHLGIEKFAVIGFCIGGPFIWNLLERAPDRVVAAVLAQPSGFRKEMPDLFYNNNLTSWVPELTKRRPEITTEMAERFLTRMYRTNADFVFTVTRDFVRSCQTPVLVLPDDIPAHPYDVAMETVMLAPNSEVSIYPWKEPPERIPIAVRQIRSFLRAHLPASA
jgi:pimeloyl-ACP methyl ester carboxylesterase